MGPVVYMECCFMMKRLPKPEVITIEQWLDEDLYPAYGANRDWRYRYKKKDHLKGDLKSADQLVVRCTDLNGKRCKIDGHSRTGAWLDGVLERPPELKLLVYTVNSEEEIAGLYRSFNSKESAETPNEMMQHYNRLKEYKPESPFMRSQWKSVYVTLHHKYNKNEDAAIEEYKKELLILDSWNVPFGSKSTKLSVGIRASMVESVRKDPDLAKKFWFTYLDEDNKTSQEVNTLREVINEHKGSLGGARVVGYLRGVANGLFDTYVTKQK